MDVPATASSWCRQVLLGEADRPRSPKLFAPTTRSAYVTNYLGYLDPGSGSLLLQGLVGGVASALVIGKVYWRRAKRFLGLGRDEPVDE
jgi:hypothetical protein